MRISKVSIIFQSPDKKMGWMSRTLGIKIDNVCISDVEAKMIALYSMGFSNAAIHQILFVSLPTLHNYSSNLYRLFDTGKSPNALVVLGQLFGFDHYGYVHGVDVLSPAERERAEGKRPFSTHYPCRLLITRVALNSENSH